ncbi:S24/S26 family peptidase [uncultured Microbacterium sp.]|uniref:S24/S26 family peptidase n=1 Tax=uncultured Microbacterium sp. TaxID=191216 RepID=UPI0025E936BA|nr:S24/S26 family peptidase [uncultured Microbacterium sp.]
MRYGRILLTAGVATARAVVTLILALLFWSAAPVVLGWTPTTVMTASMTPAIEVGDVVVARPVPHADLVPGRVVLAIDPDRPERLRLHRVSELRPDGRLVTKGDANPSADSSSLAPDAVRGVGVLRVPWVGLPAVWLRSGAVVPLALTAAGFAVCAVVALRRGQDEDPDADGPSPRVDPPAPLTRRAARAARGVRGAGAVRAAREPRREAGPANAERTRHSRRGDADAPSPAARTRRAALEQDRSVRASVRGRRVLAVIVAAAVAVAAGSSPAWAAWSSPTGTSASFTAARVVAPVVTACFEPPFDGVWVAWRYDGDAPVRFDMLVDGRTVVSGIAATTRSARVPTSAVSGLARVSYVSVRARVGSSWTADSPNAARVTSLLGFTSCG